MRGVVEIGLDFKWYMNHSKIVTQDDVELETLKKFLDNKSVIFNETLIDLNKKEPTDIRYNGINYQITEGDKEAAQERLQVTSKSVLYFIIRDISNVAEILLRGTLDKKSIRSDSNTVLLIDVLSTGGRDWETLDKELSAWAVQNVNLCNCWKGIYLVYRGKNVKLNF